jgi:hypothetical protein
MLRSPLRSTTLESTPHYEGNCLPDQSSYLEAPLSRHYFDPNKVVDLLLPVQVQEQRLSNIMQSLLVAACVVAMPVIRKIPTSVLWGYFAYMAIESLPGNQFWQRLTLLATSPSQRYRYSYQIVMSVNLSAEHMYAMIRACMLEATLYFCKHPGLERL